MLDRRLTSDDDKIAHSKIIEGEPQSPKPEVVGTTTHVFKEELEYSTQKGGLSKLPAGYQGKKGFWKVSIQSENLFEVLFLDYTQYRGITPAMVKQNHDVLLAFWKERENDLNTGQRKNITLIFGSENVVPDAVGALHKAYDKLKTEAGILDYYQTLEKKRYDLGIASIAEIVEIMLEDGELTKKEGERILEKGKANHLIEYEIIQYIIEIIKARGFKPRAAKQHDNFFENRWMTDDAYKASMGRSAKWLDEEVSSLEEVGEVSFRKKEEANRRLAAPGILTGIVTQLTGDSEIGYEYQQLLDGEANTDKRFLKVIYHLNPSLPFRLSGQDFKSINQLITSIAKSLDLYTAAQQAYGNGHLQIWLKEADKEAANQLTTNIDANSFLAFVLKINAGHGIYVNNEKFDTPLQLVSKAKSDKGWWYLISEAMQAGVLPIWFGAIGQQDWIDKYNEFMTGVVSNNFYSDDDKKMMSVQRLLEVIDDEVQSPKIVADLKNISLMALEGSKPYVHDLQVSLNNFGFVKVRVGFESQFPGISISSGQATFFSLKNDRSANFHLKINPLELVKNKTYENKILLNTAFEELLIPLEINVVFPKKAFIRQLIKYSVFGAFFFAGIRYFLIKFYLFYQELLDTTDLGTSAYYNEKEWLYLYFVALLIMVIGLFGSYFIIRKAEKI
ncbi:MAG: hypothetical protein EAY75_14575 [Bacteroidetes bacterium]|nr:MAG: hypothetical protein EAY75_14575 [Bacteroidota bacterium]